MNQCVNRTYLSKVKRLNDYLWWQIRSLLLCLRQVFMGYCCRAHFSPTPLPSCMPAWIVARFANVFFPYCRSTSTEQNPILFYPRWQKSGDAISRVRNGHLSIRPSFLHRRGPLRSRYCTSTSHGRVAVSTLTANLYGREKRGQSLPIYRVKSGDQLSIIFL